MNKNVKLELTWIGKDKKFILEPRILLENKKLSNISSDSKTENMLIHGDNLLALKALEQDYSGEIKCIYIDPPYNTGSAFENYDDNLEHSIWLNLMRPRLEILHNLLAEDGLIFVQIDDNEQAYLKVLMDEIFGRKSFVNMLTIESGEVYGTKASNINKKFVKVKDYILVYKKNEQATISIKPLWAKINEPFDSHYSYYINNKLEKTGLINYLKQVEWVVELFHKCNIKLSLNNISLMMIIDEKFNNFINYELADKIYQDQPYSGSLTEEIKLQLDKADICKINDLIFYKTSSGSIRYFKSFKDSLHNTDDYESYYCRSTARGDLWKNYHIDMRNIDDEGSVKFKNSKKPERLIRDILNAVTKEGDIVLDSFLGSGTTCAVAHKMRRRWIGIEMGEHAFSLCKPRLDNIISGQDKSGITKSVNWQGGGGYRFYELAPTLIKKDRFGCEIINPEYSPEMLAAAVCKHENFKYNPDPVVYWKQAKHDNTYIYVTTQHITATSLQNIRNDMKEKENLVVIAKTYDEGVNKLFQNIIVKKIPQALFGKCEFGKDNYNLNIITLPEEGVYDE